MTKQFQIIDQYLYFHFFSKIFEKLMCVCLNKYLLNNLILHPNQFGFRSNLSTSTALIQIVDEISRSIDEKK